MKLNRETLQNPQTLALLIPAALLLFTLYAIGNTSTRHKSYDRDLTAAQKSLANAKNIVTLKKQAGGNYTQQSDQPFNIVTFLRTCAIEAGISENKVKRGTGSRGKTLKDGTVQSSQNFELHGVYMFQIATFIDFAERNYPSMRCTQITIVPLANKTNKDSWDATINFQYKSHRR